MIKELVNLNVQEAKSKAQSRTKLFNALNKLFIFLLFLAGFMVGYLYTKGTVLMALLPKKDSGMNAALLIIILFVIWIAIEYILLTLVKPAPYPYTQQVFMGSEYLYVFYVANRFSNAEEHTVSFQTSFFLIPYDATMSRSTKGLVFRGNIRKITQSNSQFPGAISISDARLLAKEGQLKYFTTSAPCRKAVLFRVYGAAQEQELLDAISHPDTKQEPDDSDSWRTVLDQYFKEKSENTDIADTAIQSVWYADYLAKRRQKKLGVDVSETYAGRGKLHETYVGNWNDGRNIRTVVHTNGFRTRIYKMAGDSLKIAQKNSCIFSLLSSKVQKDQYTCPNCGSLSKTEDLMNGCPFCGTKFELTSYDTKLSGVHYDPVKASSALILLLPALIIVAIFFAYSLITGNHGNFWLTLGDSLFRGFIITIYALPVFIIALGIFLISKRLKANQINVLGNFVKKVDPNFSKEEFEGTINARLKGFFLADGTDNISCFTNLQPINMATLADIEILAFKRPRELNASGFLAVRSEVVLDMIYAESGKFVRKQETYTIDLYREAALQTKLMSDQEIYNCPNCAGTISILNGGHCEHCGNTVNMAHYGWVLGKAEKV